MDAAGRALRRMAGGIGLASEEPGRRSASRLGNAGDGVSGSAFRADRTSFLSRLNTQLWRQWVPRRRWRS